MSQKKQNLSADQLFVLCEQCANPLPYEQQEQGCERCGHTLLINTKKCRQRTLAFSLTALIFFIPAMFFPFMTMELNGVENTATVWGGVLDLLNAGSWFIALVVFLASVVIPIVKLLILFYLSWSPGDDDQARFKMSLYRFVEVIGRWSMLDIFLLAVLVAVMKIRPWTAVSPEVGSLMFALVVVFTLLASESFDPRLLWKESSHVKK